MQATDNNNMPKETEARLLAGLAAMAEAVGGYGRKRLAGYPKLARLSVEFDGSCGGGEILAIDMFPPGADSRPIHPEITGELLEETLPGSGGGLVAVGRLIRESVLGLLDLRHPGWKDGAGACGEFELEWAAARTARGPALRVGGTLQTRAPSVREQPLWDDGAPAGCHGREVAHADR